MYITNKEIIKRLFDDNENIKCLDIQTTDFGTYCHAIDSEGNVLKSLDSISITIDNDDLLITEYDDEWNVITATDIPLIWLLRNSTYPINAII